VEVDASRDNGASLWDTYRSPGSGKNDTRLNPQTILVPRKTVSLREAAEALADAVSEFPMFSGSGALKAAEDDLRVKRDAVRTALTEEKR